MYISLCAHVCLRHANFLLRESHLTHQKLSGLTLFHHSSLLLFELVDYEIRCDKPVVAVNDALNRLFLAQDIFARVEKPLADHARLRLSLLI
jgi:hypothetical protein